jgi:hypothetical protein
MEMSKKINARDEALNAIVAVCANYASIGSQVTEKICAALLLGATDAECIDNAKTGYQMGGQDIPRALASNIVRLATGTRKQIREVQRIGNALHGRVFDHVGIPVRTKAGRPAGQGAGETTAPTAAPTADVQPWVAALRQMRDMSSACLAWKDDKGQSVLHADDAEMLKTALADAAVILARYVPKMTK